MSELDVVLRSGFYESPRGYDNLDWFVNDGEKTGKKAFYFINNKKDIKMTEKDEKQYRIISFCRSCEKETISDKVRYHCHLIWNNSFAVSSHQKCIINVIQKRSKSMPFLFH